MMEFISSDYDGIQPTRPPEEVVAWFKGVSYQAGAAAA
jgi:hypothetical protein